MVQVEPGDDEKSKNCWVNNPRSKKKSGTHTLGENLKQYSTDKIDLINARKKYFKNEERRAQEKHEAGEKRAQEKHKMERVYNEPRIKN